MIFDCLVFTILKFLRKLVLNLLSKLKEKEHHLGDIWLFYVFSVNVDSEYGKEKSETGHLNRHFTYTYVCTCMCGACNF